MAEIVAVIVDTTTAGADDNFVEHLRCPLLFEELPSPALREMGPKLDHPVVVQQVEEFTGEWGSYVSTNPPTEIFFLFKRNVSFDLCNLLVGEITGCKPHGALEHSVADH